MKPLEKLIHHAISSILAQLREKRFFLARSRNLGLLGNTLTANSKFSRSDKVNLPLPFQIHLSKKLETFSQFFIGFLKFSFIFEHFENDQVS